MRKMMAAAVLLWATLARGGEGTAVPDSTNGWGYGYDSLLVDLARWRQSPHVRVDSIGSSVEGRALWLVSITQAGDSTGLAGLPGGRKHRVFMHARTHPGEVQAHYIAREAIRMLLDTTAQASELRAGFIFNIMPMYNPDGVEKGPGRDHGYARLNAHGVDLEANWDKLVLEPEVTALRAKFLGLMAGPVPVEVALNLHSDRLNCTRFFFFHVAAGTSAAYEEVERTFIGNVRSYFFAGIEPWSFVQSWQDGTGARYPEGFWWLNHGDKVVALTYEDANCPGASEFDATARALVLGSADYISGKPAGARPVAARADLRLRREAGGIRIEDPFRRPWSAWWVADVSGRSVARGNFPPGAAFIPVDPGLSSARLVLGLSTRDGRLRLSRMLPPLR